MSHFVEVVLELFGMSKREQLVTFGAMLVLMFALYTGRQFARQRVYSMLYMVLALALCVFLTTERPETRVAAGVTLCAVTAALFAWYFITRGRAPEGER